MNKMFATLSMTEVRTWKANCDGCTNPTCKVGGSPTLDPSGSFAIKGCTMGLKNNQLRWVACCLIFRTKFGRSLTRVVKSFPFA